MGFFSKIKENLNHGGIKLDLQAPASVSMQDSTMPVTITIINAGEQRSIKRVTAEIIATSQNQAFSSPNSAGNRTNNISIQTVARADSAEQFALAPNESKTVQLNIIMNTGAAAQEQLPEGGVMGQVAGALGKLQSIGEALNGDSYTYSIKASADVEGIALDPAKAQPLQILKPGQVGAGFNIGI